MKYEDERGRKALPGSEFNRELEASAGHQELIDRVNFHGTRLDKLDANVMVRFGNWLGPWRNRIAWIAAVVIGLYAFIYAVDRLHEVFPWVPDVVAGPTPTPASTH